MPVTERVDERLAERLAMVDQQLRRRGIKDERVLQAMARVPRHAFVPPRLRHAAYEDRALALADGQTISQPYMVARTCELLALRAEDRVLEVGAGSGYQAAVLAQLCSEVIAIELLDSLAEGARRALGGLRLEHVQVIVADGTRGFLERAPYDAIAVSAGAPTVPQPLCEQLAVGGRMAIPLGPDSLQTLTLLHKTEAGIERQGFEGCVYVPLRGSGGWADREPRFD